MLIPDLNVEEGGQANLRARETQHDRAPPETHHGRAPPTSVLRP